MCVMDAVCSIIRARQIASVLGSKQAAQATGEERLRVSGNEEDVF